MFTRSSKSILTATAFLTGSPMMAMAVNPAACQYGLSSEATVRAVGVTQNLPIGELGSLKNLKIQRPQVGPQDILVRVKAVSVNPVDTKHRKRVQASEEKPAILGWDVAGVVESVGSEVQKFKVGDEVYYAGSIARAGGNSELHAVDHRIVAKMPPKLSFEETASLPLTALTAYEGLFEQLNVKSGKSILVIGGAGGVGSMVIQMAKIAGLRVVATASRAESQTWVKKMGADHVIDHTQELQPQLLSLGLENVDYIFNTANTAQYWKQMADVIRPFGRICSIVESPEPIDLTLMMKKSVSFSWELMFTRSLFDTADLSEQSKILEQVAVWVQEEKLKPTLAVQMGSINAENLRAAHGLLESGKSVGKIVLSHWD